MFNIQHIHPYCFNIQRGYHCTYPNVEAENSWQSYITTGRRHTSINKKQSIILFYDNDDAYIKY